MNAFLANILGFACFLAILGALIRWPRVIGATVFLVMTTAGCTEASQGHLNSAVTAFFYGVLFGLLAVMAAQNAPHKRRTSP